MPDRVVLFDPRRPLAFLQDACAALARAVSDAPAVSDAGDELAVVYAEMVGARARLLREEVSRMPESSQAWLNIVNHLLERLRPVRARESALELIEIADQLHGRRREATTPLP
jgi:hypothetical protein